MARHNCADCIHKDVCALWEIQNGIGDAECVYYRTTLTPPNEWVSVEERFPENSAEVLMWREKWKIAEAGTYRNACFLVYDALGDSYKADDITYWMPLPAPPEKEE